MNNKENRKIKIKVVNKLYVDNDVLELMTGNVVKPARPLLYHPNMVERIKHMLGEHWSYGQPYCVICGKWRACQHNISVSDCRTCNQYKDIDFS